MGGGEAISGYETGQRRARGGEDELAEHLTMGGGGGGWFRMGEGKEEGLNVL